MIQEIFSTAVLAVIVLLTFVVAACLVMGSGDAFKDVAKTYKSRFTDSANVELDDMFIFMDTSKLFLINLLAMVFIPMAIQMLFQIWLLTGSVFAVLLVVPGIVWGKMRKKRLSTFEHQLPDAFMMLSSSLSAGASLKVALEDMVKQSPAPLNQEFGLLIKRMRLGVTLEDALLEMERRIPMQSFVMASSAVRISREVGGNLVETIKSMADTLRRKKTMEGKVESLTAQGKTQGSFMAALPILLAVMLSFLEPDAMRQLYTTREGLMVLVVMVIMQVMGFVFIRKITTISS